MVPLVRLFMLISGGAHGEALHPPGRIADHGHFDRVAVSADSGRGFVMSFDSVLF